jgi:hypothetical protein
MALQTPTQPGGLRRSSGLSPPGLPQLSVGLGAILDNL